jgi:Rad52/22 family double-strand break repair protein
MVAQTFDKDTLDLLKKDLSQQLISTRRAGGRSLKYIEGHTAIDQANKIFGPGNWSFETLSCEQAIMLDPATGEAVGISYNAVVRLLVRGAIGPLTEVGSHPVASWSVEEVVIGRRGDTGEALETSPITVAERIAARRTIVDAHENARKSAVTDAMKRALRVYGSALGNCLYGKGPVVLVEDVQARSEMLYPGKWEQVKLRAFKNALPDDKLTPEMLARLSRLLDAQEKKLQAEQAESDVQALQSEQVA